jgi:hypothetical protein
MWGPVPVVTCSSGSPPASEPGARDDASYNQDRRIKLLVGARCGQVDVSNDHSILCSASRRAGDDGIEVQGTAGASHGSACGGTVEQES